MELITGEFKGLLSETDNLKLRELRDSRVNGGTTTFALLLTACVNLGSIWAPMIVVIKDCL